jgi:hypothetical protein
MTGLLKLNGTAGTDTQPPSAREWREGHEFLDRATDAYVETLWEQERLTDEAEIDRLVRGALEKIYAEHIIARSKTIPKTRQSYIAAFKHFRQFCTEAGARALPARPGAVASYLHQEIQAGASPEKIRRLVAAISYGHRVKEVFDPTEDELVKAIVYSTTVKAKQKGKTNGKGEG